MKYVGFFPRLVAYIIDSLILWVPLLAISNQDLNFLASIVLSLLYFVWMNGKYGATIGKMIIKVKIVKEDGKKIDYSDALVRELGSYLSMIVLFLGFLNIVWDKRKQGWHDKIAKTVVVAAS